MGDSEKDHHYSEPSGASAPATGHHEEKQESPVNIRRRLRDREMLKRKKEESQQKDTYQEQTSSKRQRKAQGTGRGRRKQVKEPEPEPYSEPHSEPEPEPEHEPIHELQHEPRQEQHFEMEAEKKSELLSDESQGHVEHEQEPLVHHEDSTPTVTKGDTADVTLLIHEDAGGHLPQESTSLQQAPGHSFYEPVPKSGQHIPDEEVMSDLAPATETPEVLGFPLEQDQVEHQYYTPLL